MRSTRTLFLLLVLLAVIVPPAEAQEPTVIFLVRHAERADDGAMTGFEDPHLSEAGRQRAEELARVLADAGINRIHSTDYHRTRETAAPLAEATGLTAELYDGGSLEAFAERLRNTSARHLVVGHSNTTPELVKILGADPGEPFGHLEYDRLYVVTLGAAEVSTILLRFGK